ncbi:MAG: bifunctional [glutamate--ammonia ligase]-adenylyl-L-tyrosine phosphorylase/[glutamate--ammonia-ligase] adenylyltransferase, partial [Chromatiales bacterium]
KALRELRRHHMVRIVWRDLGGGAGLAETLEDLTALAEACVDGALDPLHRWLLEELGVPRDEEGREQRLVVVGMGKLGARELNLSSDIDLIFAYPADGRVEGGRRLTNEQFFIRLGQKLVQALNVQDADGFVFRVDTRLRPFGEAGPLAVSFAAMEDYYQSQAREWERYAMIKARVVAGDREAGERLTAMLRPFVYRRYLDFGAIESLREMKRLITRELHRRGMDANIKLGPGGIREIEFIGQAFQLIRGGREPDLQEPGILTVLARLKAKGYLPAYVVGELTEAYEVLRLTENRLQAWQDRQTHVLPEDAEGRLRLARSMGEGDWDTFARRLDEHRRRVQGHFDKVFAAPQADEEPVDGPLAELWRSGLQGEGAVRLVHEAGFADAEDAVERLRALRASSGFRGLGSRGRERLDQLMPLLLEAVGSAENPNATLERVLGLLEAVARRTAYLALLVESPMALSQLVKLSSASSWIARQLTRHPLLLDELLDPRRLYAPQRRDALESELETFLGRASPDDLEQQMERLRQFTQSNVLRVAAADIGGVIPLMVVSDYLTEIAEVVVARVLEQAWHDLTPRHGRPAGVLGQDTGFAVVGYGKLGGIELGYGSDLDLVFLHGSRDAGAMTDGARALANDVFYARLGQRMIHILTARTPSGVLYEVDMRLRPNGGAGLLVSSLDAFSDYQSGSAWTWEHQALIRARAVAGDAVVCARFEEIRRDILCRERDPEALRRDVREMRDKMRNQLDKSGPGVLDLKQGPGGIADIEFMVQFSVLRWAHEFPDLVDVPDNIRLLEGLARHRLLEGDAAQRLADAYRAFRAVSHRQTLQELPGLMPEDQLAEERGWVRTAWSAIMES